MKAGAEELGSLVQGGQVVLRMHDEVLFADAKAAGFRAWLVSARLGQELPLDGGLQPLIFELPDVPGKSGVSPLG